MPRERTVPSGRPRPRSAGERADFSAWRPADEIRALLADALAALARGTASTRGIALGRDRHGVPEQLAGPALELPPGDAALARLEALDGVTDLAAGDPELAAVGTALGITSAAPVRRGDEPCVAVLGLAGPADPAGSVRPRTLAALAATARRLAPPLAAARAAERVAQLDAGVRQLQRLASLGRLTSEIAHEIRNPLVSVKTFLQLLHQDADDPELRSRFAGVVEDEVRRIERLLDRVIEHARPATPEADPAPGDIAAAVEAVVTLLAHGAAQAEVRIDVELPDTPLWTAASDDALRQVLLNLARNAVEASQAGGCVAIRAALEGGQVHLRVLDDGAGVPEALRERLFEPFASPRGDRPGGLGLAISRDIAVEAGGRLWFEPRPEGGSCFHLALPAAERDANRG